MSLWKEKGRGQRKVSQVTECLLSRVCWLKPVIPALERLGQEDCPELKANLGYIVSSGSAWAAALSVSQ